MECGKRSRILHSTAIFIHCEFHSAVDGQDVDTDFDREAGQDQVPWLAKPAKGNRTSVFTYHEEVSFINKMPTRLSLSYKLSSPPSKAKTRR